MEAETSDGDVLWYAMADLPAGRCRVRVVAQGRVFEAVRALAPGRGLSWCLPPPAKGGAIEWRHDLEPDAWQPSVAGWTWPNGRAPAPLDTKPDRMWSSTMRFGAVEDAEAAELAREMERDRVLAGRTGDGPPEPVDPQRWRDVHEVAYREPGKITVAEVEARVCRALCYEKTIKGDTKKQRSNAAVLADLKRVADLHQADPTEDYRPPFQPTDPDICDYTVVMDWITEAYIDKPGFWAKSDEREIMAGRILDPPKAWTEIGEALGMSRQSAKKRYDRLMERLTVIANAGNHVKLAAVADRVQSRNRAWKRMAGVS